MVKGDSRTSCTTSETSKSSKSDSSSKIEDQRTNAPECEEEEDNLTVIGRSLILVIKPVSLSLLLIYLIVKSVCTESDVCRRGYMIPFPYQEEEDQDMGSKLRSAFLHVSVMLAFIVVATFLLLLVFYLRWYSLLMIYCLLSLCCILTMFTINFLFAILTAFEIACDWPTIVLLVANFAIIGILGFTVLVIPILLKQAYLIFISSMVSLWIILKFPPWSTWLLLFVLIFWDLCAVLTPCGPLKLIIEMIENRRKKNNENIKLPAMMAYSTVVHLLSSGAGSFTMLMAQPENAQSVSTSATSKRDFKPTLGLGDFVFYSIVIGQTALTSPLITTLYSAVAILFGLISTLILLAFFRRALPALPISLLLALPTVLVMSLCGESYSVVLNTRLIFI